MTKYIRIDKREARRVYENGGTVVMSLNKPEVPMGEPVEFDGVTTCSKNSTGGLTFDALAVDSLQWKHRYPGSQGLVWYTPAPEPLTPYDTGERLKPIPWVQEEALRHSTRPPQEWGMVDFDNEEGATVFKLHAEKCGEGYMLKVQDLSYTPLSVEVESEMVVVSPEESLRENVKNIIAADLDPQVRDEAEVYYAANSRRALILVPGEKHVRKQLLIMVTDVGEGEPYSAYVKGWARDVRETRLG